VASFDGEDWKIYSSDHGLAGDTVFSIVIDQEDAVWFETDGGISRLRDGLWDQFVAREGEEVQQGQIVIRLDTSRLELERDVAKARYEAALAQLRLLEAMPRKVDLAVAQAAVDQAVAILDGANKALEDAHRVTPLRVRDEQVSLAKASVDQAEAGLEAAQVVLETLERGAKQSDLEAARAALEAAKAELEQLTDQIEHGESRSPIDAVLLDHLLLPGELALPGWPIALLADLSQLEVTIYLPEADLGVANIGDTVKVTVDAYPDRTFSGQVIQVAERAEFTPRSVQTPEERVILVYAVRIRVLNPDGALKPGLPADVTMGAGS
jgi:multidrug resistance efflux pump